MKQFYSNGKLLISGEYVVLDGALSLAIPTSFGQKLEVKAHDENTLNWRSYNDKGALWFETKLAIEDLFNGNSHIAQNPVLQRLVQIILAAIKLNPSFAQEIQGKEVQTRLNFPNNWGLGTSSTLINNISNWANVDPFKLLDLTFGGSGYDIACAQHNSPITYQLSAERPIINDVRFDPSFKQHLYFVYLNQKQNSSAAIAHYTANKGNLEQTILKVNKITNAMVACDNLDQFEALLFEHEQILSEVIGLTPIKSQFFSDFKGAIKSLGAWGGDFILAASRVDPRPYFEEKGFHTILPYKDMIIK